MTSHGNRHFGVALSTIRAVLLSLTLACLLPATAMAAPASGATTKGGIEPEITYIHADGFESLLLAFTSPDSATFAVGDPGSFSVTTSEPAALELLGSLPEGLAFDAGTGVIAGTPAPGTAGVRALQFTAVNASGQRVQILRLTVNEAPAITSPDQLACEAGTDCDFQFTASGRPAPTYSLPGLPDGLVLDGSSGVLSGIPALGTQGVYALSLTADNGVAPAAVQTFTLDVSAASLRITAVAPAVLVPGTSATLTGMLFDPVPANNIVTVDGVAMPVTAASVTSLTVTVPCIASGVLPLRVEVGPDTSPEFFHPLAGNLHELAVGESAIVTDPTSVGCNELAATGTASRYLVAVYSANTSPNSNAPFQFSGDGPQARGGGLTAERAPPALPAPGSGLQYASPLVSQETLEAEAADAAHLRILEANEREYARLFQQFRDDPQMALDTDVVLGDPVEPPPSRTFRISNLNPPAGATNCSSYYVVAATRVYYDGAIAIYEDDATPAAFKAANNPVMASNYQRIGDQFNADMEPIVRSHFGDILRRDAVTDNNGALVALFTPHINDNVPGVAGFVVACDQFPNDDQASPGVGGPYTTAAGFNGASNFGEYFYAYQPRVDADGYSGNTPQNWYRTIRSTFIHESKHVASQAARVANDASTYEVTWLEEGTARHAEELWMRNAVDLQDWKSNIGYGSFDDPINVYCDVRPTFAECDANPRRPASIMQRHFTSLYTQLFAGNARLLSPFGATASDSAAYFYAVSWSLVRYATDRYGTSDADFLGALTQSNSAGVDNLIARAGVPIDELLGGWALALVADDRPGLEGNPDVAMPSWNFRDIYAGLNADFPGTYTLAYPQQSAQFVFGSFDASPITTLRGGGVLWYELSGTQMDAQVLRLEGNGGNALPSSVRVAILRLP